MLFRVCTLAAGLIALTSAAGCEGCGNGGGFDAMPPESGTAGATFSLSWSLFDDAANRPVDCDKVDPNATVFVQVKRGGGAAESESFSCKPLQGTSSTALIPGTYNFSYELHMQLDGQVFTVAEATPQTSVVIRAGQPVTLAPIAFHFRAVGGLEVMLQAGSTGNCVGGAAITGFAIAVEHNGDPPDTGCAPVVFTLSGGGTYNANDCSSPAVTRCIAATETLTVASLPSGPYQIHVRGKKGTLDCWANNDTLRVPPQDRTLHRTLNLALATGTPGCP
jgi:hypothetical protein